MVFESLISPFKAEQHPGWLLLHGAIYAFLALGLSMWLFREYASLVTVFLICAACIPLLYNIIRYEEDKDYHELPERALIKEHGRAVLAYFCLFVGITLALALAFILMPPELVQPAFEAQIQTYQAINPTHAVAGVTGYATAESAMDFFTMLFLNNMKVLVFCIVFSFFYGAGAIFILTWNASVIALAIGNKIRTEIAQYLGAAGLTKAGAYLSLGAKTVFLRYGIHGSLEIIAYIIAGLAGGIISVAVARHHFSTKKFEHIIIDSTDLILIAIAILFLAGVLEAFVTPLFY